ncbi:MAG: PHB depolymerase family esterase [Planctomycetota bacterium]
MSHAATNGLRVLLVAFILCHAGHTLTAVGEEGVPRPSNGKGGVVGTFPDEKIDINGSPREYRLVVPKSVDGKKPVPILFAFHGFLIDNKDLMAAYSQLDRLAEKEGFVLVFPNGKDQAWRLIPALAKDDFAFFDELLAHLAEKYNVDRNRVYLCGMSNGAYFSHLLASQRSDVVAAIACHSGGLGILSRREPSVKHKYGVLIVHGEDDSIVKVDEGRKARDAYQKWGFPCEYLEVPQHNHFWALKADVNTKMWKFLMAHPLDAQ